MRTEPAIAHLDFDYWPACEVRTGRGICRGQNGAEWKVTLVKCCDELASTALFCTDCLNYKLSLRLVKCRFCGTVFRPPSTAYKYIERLS